MSTATATATQKSVTPSRQVSVRQRVDELLGYIQTGKILEAMNEFYAPDVSMRENGNPPTVGLAANVEREKQFLSQVKVWKGFTVLAVAVEGDVSLVENRVEFTHTSGAEVKMEQVSVARWRDGKIVEERFYYDSAK
jgi:ketosteroid isomerase-like protein